MRIENLLKKYPPLINEQLPLESGARGAFVGVIGPFIHFNRYGGVTREHAELRWDNGELLIYGKLGWKSFPVRNAYDPLTREQIAHFRHYGRWPGDPPPKRVRKKAGTATPAEPVVELTQEEKDKKLVHDLWTQKVAYAQGYSPALSGLTSCCGVYLLYGLNPAGSASFEAWFKIALGRVVLGLKERGHVMAAATNNQTDVIPLLERIGFRRIGEPNMNNVHYGQTAIQLWQVTYDQFSEKWGLPGDPANTERLKKLIEEGKI